MLTPACSYKTFSLIWYLHLLTKCISVPCGWPLERRNTLKCKSLNKVVLIHISALVGVLRKILLACVLYGHFSSMNILKLKLCTNKGRPTFADMKEALELTQTSLRITRYVNTHDEMPTGKGMLDTPTGRHLSYTVNIEGIRPLSSVNDGTLTNLPGLKLTNAGCSFRRQ
jgi:hypothetical protein